MKNSKFHDITRNRSEFDNDSPVTKLPGAVLNIGEISRSTIHRWVKNGWIELCGEAYILTRSGYQQA